MVELRDCFLQIDISEVRHHGPHHTWSNKQPDDPIAKKLDRLMVDSSWLSTYPNSLATFLAPEMSDHSLCLLNTVSPLPSARTKPFKFFNFLTTHPLFLQTVESAWTLSGNSVSNLTSFNFKLKGLKRCLKTLNRENYSDIQTRVRETNNFFAVCTSTISTKSFL